MALPSASAVNWSLFYKEDKDKINMVRDAYVQQFTPIPGKMLIDDPVIDKITKHMKMFDAHSGSSLGWTFAQILHFAKNGVEYL